MSFSVVILNYPCSSSSISLSLSLHNHTILWFYWPCDWNLISLTLFLNSPLAKLLLFKWATDTPLAHLCLLKPFTVGYIHSCPSASLSPQVMGIARHYYEIFLRLKKELYIFFITSVVRIFGIQPLRLTDCITRGKWGEMQFVIHWFIQKHSPGCGRGWNKAAVLALSLESSFSKGGGMHIHRKRTNIPEAVRN